MTKTLSYWLRLRAWAPEFKSQHFHSHILVGVFSVFVELRTSCVLMVSHHGDGLLA